MNTNASGAAAPRSIDQYLKQLRDQLAGEDPALIQDALYDAEEYLRAEVAAHADKSESDVLELIASTYGAPDEVAAAYRNSEATVKAALKMPAGSKPQTPMGRFFDIYLDPRAYTSLAFMILSLVTGTLYFTFVVTGLSLAAGLSVLIVGIPFLLLFLGITRVLSLAEGRLIEAITGERMPRRPQHPGSTRGFWARVLDMLADRHTWFTLGYLALMLPLGICYFTAAVTGLAVSLSLIFAPLVEVAGRFGGDRFHSDPAWLGSAWLLPLWVLAGILLLTVMLHLARGVGRAHAHFAKRLLVAPTD